MDERPNQRVRVNGVETELVLLLNFLQMFVDERREDLEEPMETIVEIVMRHFLFLHEFDQTTDVVVVERQQRREPSPDRSSIEKKEENDSRRILEMKFHFQSTKIFFDKRFSARKFLQGENLRFAQIERMGEEVRRQFFAFDEQFQSI